MEMYLFSLFCFSVPSIFEGFSSQLASVSEVPLPTLTFSPQIHWLDSIPTPQFFSPVLHVFLILTFLDGAGVTFRGSRYWEEDYKCHTYPKELFTMDTHNVPKKDERKEDKTGTWRAQNKKKRVPELHMHRCDFDWECWHRGLRGWGSPQFAKSEACCCQLHGWMYSRHNKKFRSCTTREECKEMNGVCVSFWMWHQDNGSQKADRYYDWIHGILTGFYKRQKKK